MDYFSRNKFPALPCFGENLTTYLFFPSDNGNKNIGSILLQEKGLQDYVFNIHLLLILFLTNILNCQVALFTGSTENCAYIDNIYYLECILRRFCIQSHPYCACGYLTSYVVVNWGLWAQANYTWTLHWLQLVWYKNQHTLFISFFSLTLIFLLSFTKSRQKIPHINYCQSSHTVWDQT